MQVLFRVRRNNSAATGRIQTYSLDVDSGSTVLECLNRIKWELDGTLAFRKNCRNTICGSCAMEINGRPALACKETIAQELARLPQPETLPSGQPQPDAGIPELWIGPMGNMPVIRDLVVDMSSFWHNLEAIKPSINTSRHPLPDREFRQSPAERTRLDQPANCILCGACYAACNAREVSQTFVGPHALAKAYRMVADTRDQVTAERLDQYNQGLAGVWGCTRCFNCNTVCPMDVQPLDQITKIKSAILTTAAPATHSTDRPVRHRQVLIDLVRQGGWLDERRFGLQVVGNRFRDIPGLLSLLPLGIAMLRRGKFPGHFEPSPGTTQVRSLIDSVKMLQSTADPPSTASTMNPSTESPTPTSPEPELDLARPEPAFGWTPYAEQINGRFAMIGFVALLLLELFTHQDFFTWLGLR